MTVSDLFRVSSERQWVKIKHEGFTIYYGLFKDVPERLLDCTIRNIEPSYFFKTLNSSVEIFVIYLND